MALTAAKLGAQGFGVSQRAKGVFSPMGTSAYRYQYADSFNASGDYISTPSAAANQVTGDITIISQLAMNSWQPTSVQTIIAKDDVATQRSYALNVQPTGLPRFNYSTTGSAIISVTSTAAYTFADSSMHYIAVERTASTGQVRFYTSEDKVTWTLLSTVAGTAGNIFAGTAPVQFGNLAATALSLAGKIYDSEIYTGLAISGTATLNVDFDPANYVMGTGWTSIDTGEVWTLNGNAKVYKVS